MKEKDIDISKRANETLGLNIDIVYTRDQTQNKFKELAEDIWTRRGARFGEIQTMNDIDREFDERGYWHSQWLPEKLKDGQPFLTCGTSIQSGDSYGAICVLWVRPIKKNGEPSLRSLKFLKVPIEDSWNFDDDEDEE